MVATALTACGIETLRRISRASNSAERVATALTACGIETPIATGHSVAYDFSCNSAYRLRY